MKTAFRTTLLSGAALALAFPAFSQSAPPHGGDVIVVTGSATPVEYEKVGNSLTVIGEELIEDQGYSYVSDVLRQVPGLAVSRTGPFGGMTQVRIRGAEGNHTLVLLDGIDLSNAGQGETDLATLLSGDIERIEVLRGPQSGLYGSNALAGVVNIITRRDVDGHYIRAGVEGGSFNTLQLQGSGGFGNGEDYLSAGFHMLTTDGYDVSESDLSVDLSPVPGDEEGSRLANVYVRGGKQILPVLRVDGIARFVNRQSDLDGQSFSPPIAGRTYDDASESSEKDFNIAGSGTLTLLDGRWATIASGVHTETENAGTDFFFPSGARSPSGNVSSRTKYTLQSTIEFGAPSFFNFLTGFAESKDEKYRNTCPAGSFCSPEQIPEQSRELVGFGLQYRAEIAEQLYLSGTIRHDDNDDFEDADTYNLAASWVVPSIGTRPHASIGTGVTNPTFFEQFGFDPGTFIGNPDLVPEEAQGWDAGVEQTLFGGRLVVDLTYFEATLKNEIVTVFGPPPLFESTPINSTEDSNRQGAETSFRIYPTDTFDIVGSYTWLDATEPAGIELRRPENSGSLDASWRVGGGPFQLNAGVTWNGEQVDTDFATFSPREVDAYTLVRIGASYQLNDQVELYGRIENLTDEDYEEVISFRGSPQAVYVGVRFREGTAK